MAYHLKHKPEKWIKDTRVLCLDHSARRIGMAVCDAGQTVITPLPVIHRKKWAQDKSALGKIISDYQIGMIVIGYPLNMDGSAGTRCKSVKDFAALIAKEWPDVTVFFFDERLSTVAVDDHGDKFGKNNKDSLAASEILEDVFDFITLKTIA